MSPSLQEAARATLLQRAEHHAGQRRLVVDYYRIRRKLAFPLPVTSPVMPQFPTALGGAYPWWVWLTWDLEERLLALGWSVQMTRREEHLRLARRDLLALCQWPRYYQYQKQPDLVSGHTLRVLTCAARRWAWLDDADRRTVVAACRRAVDDLAPWVLNHWSAYDRAPDPRHVDLTPTGVQRWHNIAVIGSMMIALAAKVGGHPDADALVRRMMHGLRHLLDHAACGFTEGLGYDGYVWDFAADLFAVADPQETACVLEHPALAAILRRSWQVSAPGDAVAVVEIGDVEPRQMPYHLSLLAKSLSWRNDPQIRWHLRRCNLQWIRSDGLAALAQAPEAEVAMAPSAGFQQAGSVLMLRTGYEAQDLAAAVSCPTCPMGHLHFDAGSLALGTTGRWLIDDPGYQQYLQKAERNFTLGTQAHNAPVIDGRGQSVRGAARVMTASATRLLLDLTGCYEAAGLRSVQREVNLDGHGGLRCTDRLQFERDMPVQWTWHGHRDAAWWAEDGVAIIDCHPVTLTVACDAVPIEQAMIDRLPGSRGQVSLVAGRPLVAGAHEVTWTFALQP